MSEQGLRLVDGDGRPRRLSGAEIQAMTSEAVARFRESRARRQRYRQASAAALPLMFGVLVVVTLRGSTLVEGLALGGFVTLLAGLIVVAHRGPR